MNFSAGVKFNAPADDEAAPVRRPRTGPATTWERLRSEEGPGIPKGACTRALPLLVPVIVSDFAAGLWRRLVQANRVLEGNCTNNLTEMEGMILATELLQSLLMLAGVLLVE